MSIFNNDLIRVNYDFIYLLLFKKNLYLNFFYLILFENFN